MSHTFPNEGLCDQAECHCSKIEYRKSCEHFTFDFGDVPLHRFAAAICCRVIRAEGEIWQAWADIVSAPDYQWAKYVAINQGREHVKGGVGYCARVVLIPDAATPAIIAAPAA